MPKDQSPIDYDWLFDNPEELDAAMSRGAYLAIARHKALNQPIVVWRDGEPTWIAAEDIDLDAIRPSNLSSD